MGSPGMRSSIAAAKAWKRGKSSTEMNTKSGRHADDAQEIVGLRVGRDFANHFHFGKLGERRHQVMIAGSGTTRIVRMDFHGWFSAAFAESHLRLVNQLHPRFIRLPDNAILRIEQAQYRFA
jgi:hypothetical protein